MMPVTERRRRKKWARETSAKLHSRHRSRHFTPDLEPGYTAEPLPAEPEDIESNRHAQGIPQSPPDPNERRTRHIEHLIRPSFLATCLREPKLRDRLPMGEVSLAEHWSDLLTACAEWGIVFAGNTAVFDLEFIARYLPGWDGEITDDDYEFVKLVTGNVPQPLVVTHWGGGSRPTRIGIKLT